MASEDSPVRVGQQADADDLLLAREPFLLIARTDRVVTAIRRGGWRVPSDTRVFQHLASCTSRIASEGGSTLERATLGTLLLLSSHLRREWPGHFCLALHVAMQVGLSLHSSRDPCSSAWRTVSEDPTDSSSVSC